MKQACFVMVLVAASAGMGASPAPSGDPDQGVVARTPHFAFHSDLATNVNDALLEAGRARNKGNPELFHAGEEVACFDALAPSAQTAWNLAVDYYGQVISPKKFSDRVQVLLRFELSGVKELTRERDQRYVGMVRGFIAAGEGVPAE